MTLKIYIWNKLHEIKGGAAPQQLYASISETNAMFIENVMLMISELMNCDTWRLFLLSKPAQDRGAAGVSWRRGAAMYPRVINAFTSGISHYEGAGSTFRSSELVVPLLFHGKVCAVLQLLNKRVKRQDLRSIESVNHTVLPFTEDDINAARLGCELATNMIKNEGEVLSMDLCSAELLVLGQGSLVSHRLQARRRSSLDH